MTSNVFIATQVTQHSYAIKYDKLTLVLKPQASISNSIQKTSSYLWLPTVCCCDT